MDAYDETLAYLSALPGIGWVPGPSIRKRVSATPAAVNRALKQLVTSGRVEKMPYVYDKRQNVYRLTHAPLRLVVGHGAEPTDHFASLALDVLECGHEAISHFLPEKKESPYVHEGKKHWRRCLLCAPSVRTHENASKEGWKS